MSHIDTMDGNVLACGGAGRTSSPLKGQAPEMLHSSTFETADALARNEVFAALNGADLWSLAQACRRHDVGRDQILYSRHSTVDTLYLIARGSVCICVTSRDGTEMTLCLVAAPDTFGELPLLAGSRHVGTARTRESSSIVDIPGEALARVVRDVPAAGSMILVSLVAKVHCLEERLAGLVLLDLRSRLARMLASSMATGGGAPDAAGRVAVRLDLTQGELSRLVGASRQQVNRAILDLERAGAIERDGSRIVAVRPDLLHVDV